MEDRKDLKSEDQSWDDAFTTTCSMLDIRNNEIFLMYGMNAWMPEMTMLHR